MSVGQIVARLTQAKTEIQRVPDFARQADTALQAAAALVAGVLDDVADKSLATRIRAAGADVTADYRLAQAAVPDIDATIRRFRGIGGR